MLLNRTSVIVEDKAALKDSPLIWELSVAIHENVDPITFDVNGKLTATPEHDELTFELVIAGMGFTVTVTTLEFIEGQTPLVTTAL